MANAILASILSFFIPGLGQAISGEILKGIFLFVCGVLLLYATFRIFHSWVFYTASLLYRSYAGYDAYVMNI